MRISIAAALVFTMAATVRASGQTETPVRGFIGGEVLIATPTGEFAENVGTGFGLGLHGRYALDPTGLLSLRADVGFLNYGQETIRICVTDPCRVTGDLTTSNNIVFGGLGPELGIEGGPFRMYGNVSAGFAYFGTTSSAEGSNNDGDPFASSTNFDDATFAWMAGGGLQLGTQVGRYPVFVDVGGRYHGNGEAQYLRKGDITDLPDGSVLIDPQQSDTNLWTFRLGVSVGIPEGEEEDRGGR
jgi:hypothetical protein